MTEHDDRPNDIAIIGMACRFPGAGDLDAFWDLLDAGREGMTDFAADPSDPSYVPRAPVLEDIDRFDAGFFDIPAAEAAMMDPQHRLFLETAWTALEHAGEPPSGFSGAVGCFAGAGFNSYLLSEVAPALARSDPAALYQALNANAGDFLATRVAYKLGLTGPAMTVQSACSTSLVAVHLACQSLLAGESDMALAGGVTVRVPHRVGYRYQPGMIFSPDGHCRAFGADAAGTVAGSGAGVVVLRRYADAVAAGDTIHAVILGSAVNNDGSLKAGFSAPSAEGQARVIAEALAVAGLDPADIAYVEAHGTATPLGDPIEVEALNRVFGALPPGSCGLGSVKSNLGHLDAAAGVAGLIKTVLCLSHRRFVPSLHAGVANPAIPFAAGPFRTVTAAGPWPAANGAPRRAGVSSFGIGGTNAHIVVEDAPLTPCQKTNKDVWRVFPLSARSAEALSAQAASLAKKIVEPSGDGSFSVDALQSTLCFGRTAFRHRRAVIARSLPEAAAALSSDPAIEGEAGDISRPVAFLFPGQGVLQSGAVLSLHGRHEVFTRELDRAAAILQGPLNGDPLDILRSADAATLARTALAQPLTLAVSWALACQWQAWGVAPASAIGHSLGEYTAACLAGVISLDDALRLVAARGRLMQALPPGAMLAAPLSEADVLAMALPGLDLAAVNGERMCVLAGPFPAIAAAERDLAARGVEGRRLQTSHAFHSAMMEPVLDAFATELARIRLEPPRIPLFSNLTGRRMEDREATDPDYWLRHLRQPVRFADGLAALLDEPDIALLECGPGRVLSGLATRHPKRSGATPVVTTLPGGRDEDASLAEALGRLWVAGVPVDWERVTAGQPLRRVPLPGTAFQRRRFWIEPGAAERPPATIPPGTILLPSWRRSLPPAAMPDETSLLVFADAAGLAVPEAEKRVTVIRPGDCFARLADGGFALDPVDPAGFSALLGGLAQPPGQVIFGWTLDRPAAAAGLVGLIQAMGRCGLAAGLTVLCRGAADVTGDETLDPASAALSGLLRVAGQEFPTLRCRLVDIDGGAGLETERTAVPRAGEPLVALRRGHRWVQRFEPVDDDPVPSPMVPLQGPWLVLGGLGAVGSALAGAVAGLGARSLILVQRRPQPPPATGEDAETTRRRRRLAALSAVAETVVAGADASDASAIAAVISQAESRFGHLAGVIHAAGVKEMAALAGIGGVDIDRAITTKLDALAALDQALAGRSVPVLVASSLSAVLGALGLAGYAAAHAAADAWVLRRNRHSATPWTVVDWDNWRLPDMAGPPLPDGEPALDAAQGQAVVARLLACGVTGQVVVSAADLEARLRRWVGGGFLKPVAEAPTGASHHPRPALTTPFREAGSGAEKTLAGIWQDLLGVAPIGLDDDLFELGADSLMGIQFAARAGQAGLGLGLSDLFARPTVAALAEAIAAPAPEAEDGGGAFPPTPIQRWFVDRDLRRPGRWVQSVVLDIEDPRVPPVLATALAALEQRHDILRLRLGADGQCRIAPEATAGVLTQVDRPGASPSKLLNEIAGTLDPVAGPVWRAVLLRSGPRPQLLLCVHHLVVDLPSWPVLAGDLAALCAALVRGETPVLPSPGTAFAAYARQLDRLARDPAVAAERSFWVSATAGFRPLTFDHPEAPDTVAAEASWQGCLDRATTAVLTARPARMGRPHLHDALLTALVQAVGRKLGAGPLPVDLEGHGRMPPLPLDLGRSVGWFTTLYPLALPSDPANRDPVAAVTAVAERLDAVPGRGLGYGLLRHVLGEPALQDRPAPEIAYLYLGDSLDSGAPPLPGFSVSSDPVGEGRDPDDRRAHALELMGRLSGGGLDIRLAYPGLRYQPGTMAALGEEIVNFLKALAVSAAPEFTDDALDSELSMQEIAELLEEGDVS
jgi:non-ribosomal peptide synthase protein (TIGR01720 family)